MESISLNQYLEQRTIISIPTTYKFYAAKERLPMWTTRQIALPDFARPRPRQINSNWIVVGQDIAIWLYEFGRLIGPTGG